MSLSFGGLALLSVRTSFSELAGVFLGKGHIKSIFCLLIFVIVVLLLAYLTNPSETSFRAYLTEQSFRLHLSHLDDHVDDKDIPQDDSSKGDRSQLLNSDLCHRGHDHASFHFAKRASVSLRTPKHVFHNFGVFTIAAMMPVGKGSARNCHSPSYRLRDRDVSSLIADSWYIGAFGRWWRGGIIEAWYRDLIARSSDEESWSSGILGMKSLDKFHHSDYNGLPFVVGAYPSRNLPPKLRDRDKPLQPRQPRSRSQSPPPLPQSASLPLHTTHPELSPLVIPTNAALPVVTAHLPQLSEQAPLGLDPSPALSRTQSTALFDQSPLIAEVLRQITAAKLSIQDVRTQLTEHEITASQSHLTLQKEVDALREKKREEDVARLDLKSRTKALEDSKRTAESSRRDAERRLKAARTARDDVSRRVDSLAKEINGLRKRCDEDENSIRQKKELKGISESEVEINEALEGKRKEIKVAEDVVAALGLRAKELEDKLASEKERLKALRDRVDLNKQAVALLSTQSALGADDHESWSFGQSRAPSLVPEHHARREITFDNEIYASSLSDEVPYRPSRAHTADWPLSLGSISDYNDFHPSTVYANGYSVLNKDLIHLVTAEHPTTNFSPFSDSDNNLRHGSPTLYDVQSPITPGLVPSSVMSSIDSAQPISRSFQSDSDMVVDKVWRVPQTAIQNQGIGQTPHNFHASGTSPLSQHGSSAAMGSESRIGGESPEGEIMQHRYMPLPHRTYSDPPPQLANQDLSWQAAPFDGHDGMKGGFPRRWFSTSLKDKPRKGLNPDAKVFSLPSSTKGRSLPIANPTSASSNALNYGYDALNPNGLNMSSFSSSAAADNSLFSRAFAPSPAEREALQRALGGSSNASLERLPSLSDVGSIPSSPSHVHASPLDVAGGGGIGVGLHHQHSSHVHHSFTLPSWLQSLPRVRKPNFSPWDDELTPTIEMGGERVAVGSK